MKKIYQSEKWKRHSERISKRTLQKKRNKKGIRLARARQIKARPYKHRIEFLRHKDKKESVEAKAPSNFSILNNTDEMLSFFSAVRNYVKEYKKISFNMSAISKMTEDAILYMLSRFEDFKRLDKYIKLSGNVPIDDRCRRLLQESGFYEHVKPSVPVKAESRNILSIKSDRQVLGRIAKEVVDFTYTHLRKRDSVVSRNIYSTLIECMANTRHHAFKIVHDPRSKWWLIALFREKDKCVHFTFLDDGLSIPRTIPKILQEKVRSLFPGGQDSKLIRSALEGFRTETRLKWRGTGLPKIRSYVKKGTICNLKIISSKGYISCTGQQVKDRELDKRFHGTLLSWDIL